MDSQKYIEENPYISVSVARDIVNQHDIDGNWLTFAFTDHPEALTYVTNTPEPYYQVHTATLLEWLGY